MAKRPPDLSDGIADGLPTDGPPVRILEDYLAELKAVRSSGAGVPETSYYPALSNLFNAVGKTLRPKVRCIIHISDQGAGIPDGGLFTADQFQRRNEAIPKAGQLPARGAIEAKGPKHDAKAIAATKQVKGYLNRYGIVIVTNLREFLVIERGAHGEPVERESFTLADSEPDFWQQKVAHARARPRPSAGRSRSSSSVPAFMPRPWGTRRTRPGSLRRTPATPFSASSNRKSCRRCKPCDRPWKKPWG